MFDDAFNLYRKRIMPVEYQTLRFFFLKSHTKLGLLLNGIVTLFQRFIQNNFVRCGQYIHAIERISQFPENQNHFHYETITMPTR